MFIAIPSSVAFARKYPKVMMMDCTYKTNRHMMPMLKIIGITITFNIGFAILSSETEKDWLCDPIAVPEVTN